MKVGELAVLLAYNIFFLAFAITLYRILKIRRKIFDHMKANHSAVFNKMFAEAQKPTGIIASPRRVWKLVKEDSQLFKPKILLDEKLLEYQIKYKKHFMWIISAIVIYILCSLFIVKIILASRITH